jgi:RimJ/RimL family protein N-acetyltransferase
MSRRERKKLVNASIPTDLELETLRCFLRYPVLADVPCLFSAFQSPSFPKYVPLGQISSLEQVKTWIEGSQSRWAEGRAFTWTIELKQDHTVAGQVTVARMPDPGLWALAFWTHPECWGQGYATEAASGAIEFAFDELGAIRVEAGAAKWNLGSLRVLEKLGMAYRSDNPEGYTINQEPIPTQEYELTLSMWQNARIQFLEGLALNAWPSLQTLSYDGWMLRFANGYTRRANSVNPVYHSGMDVTAKIETCEKLYRRQGLKVVFKMTPASQPQDLDSILAAQEYQADARTSVQLLNLSAWSQPAMLPDVAVYEAVTEEWFSAFCELSGIDSRYHSTARQLLQLIAPAHVLAAISQNGQVVTCGLGVAQGEWVGLFDVIVGRRIRRQGYGRQLVNSLLTWGRRQGARTAYLQVMLNNEPALQLYSKLGFQEQYQYWYRVKE